MFTNCRKRAFVMLRCMALGDDPTWLLICSQRKSRPASRSPCSTPARCGGISLNIDDIVQGTVAAIDRPPAGVVPHRLYNLGNSRSEKLTDFIAEIEKALGTRAMTW